MNGSKALFSSFCPLYLILVNRCAMRRFASSWKCVVESVEWRAVGSGEAIWLAV